MVLPYRCISWTMVCDFGVDKIAPGYILGTVVEYVILEVIDTRYRDSDVKHA